MEPTADECGRRERNKARTRDRLLTEAGRLFADHGFAATSVSAIAEAADVSERTFFRYFATKEDLLLPGVQELLTEVEHALTTRPIHEPPMVAIRAAVAEAVAHRAEGTAALVSSGLDAATVRALAGRVAVVALDWERRFGAVVAERLRRSGSGRAEEAIELRGAVIASAAMAACRAALRLHREGSHPRSSLPQMVSDALDVLDEADSLVEPGRAGRL